jgi:hypothetical protein
MAVLAFQAKATVQEVLGTWFYTVCTATSIAAEQKQDSDKARGCYPIAAQSRDR